GSASRTSPSATNDSSKRLPTGDFWQLQGLHRVPRALHFRFPDFSPASFHLPALPASPIPPTTPTTPTSPERLCYPWDLLSPHPSSRAFPSLPPTTSTAAAAAATLTSTFSCCSSSSITHCSSLHA
ncbi:unnamed protein product, partial [Closterium sp. NIES-54]